MKEKVTRSEEEWKQELTPEQFKLLRRKGTEPPFTGRLLHNAKRGAYVCAGCGNKLFLSDAKFDSGSGWPSFYAPAEKDSVEERLDSSHGMQRTEVVCPKCGGHLGHVFDDGPKPTGLRYCINSGSLKFEQEESGEDKG